MWLTAFAYTNKPVPRSNVRKRRQGPQRLGAGCPLSTAHRWWQPEARTTKLGRCPQPSNSFDEAIATAPLDRLNELDEWREASRVALRIALGSGDEILVRFDNVIYSTISFGGSASDAAESSAKTNGIKKAVTILKSARIIAAHYGGTPEAISTLPTSLHVWVRGVASAAWAAGLHRNAVEEAARNIEVQLRIKTGKADGTGAPLVTDAFSPKPPAVGDPRLRFPEFEEHTNNWKNAHEGAMAYGRGCMMRIRNLYTHGHEPTVEEAYEAVVALSLLARWIDAAVVEVAP